MPIQWKKFFLTFLFLTNTSIVHSGIKNELAKYQHQGSSCNKNIVKSIPNNVKITAKKQSECIANAEELLQKMKNSKQNSLVIIDTRSKTNFDKFSIKNSIVLPASAIQTKTYWKNKSIYLVNDDVTDLQLTATCSRLKQKGFLHVKVISGGINAWANKQMPLVGKLPNEKNLILLTASDIWNSRKNPSTLYILDRNFRQFQKYFQRALIIENSKLNNPLPQVNNYIKSHKNFKPHKIYFLTNSPSINTSTISNLNKKQIYASFLFNANPTVLNQYITDFNKILIAKKIGPKKPKCN
ncbi:MAG: hypothetical protein CSA42_07275 [Gammaproteobacteria bacterium]|nr:MAG: hypothetical protein CSA42_07275 [Gammaproteobacteria bacterium]